MSLSSLFLLPSLPLFCDGVFTYRSLVEEVEGANYTAATNVTIPVYSLNFYTVIIKLFCTFPSLALVVQSPSLDSLPLAVIGIKYGKKIKLNLISFQIKNY